MAFKMPIFQDLYVELDLEGPSGNAYVILGQMEVVLKEGGVHQTIREQFHTEATSGDYDHLLATVEKYVCT